MQQRLQKIFQQSFGLDHIDDSMSIQNVKNWDSMAHVGLMMALQQEFGVSISPAVAIELTDIAGIKKFLLAQGIK